MFNPFKTKYRICQCYTTSVDKVSGATYTYEPHYEIEYRNLATILFGKTWESLTLQTFVTYDVAKSYLQQHINDKYEKKLVHKHKKVIFEIEP